MKIACAVVTLLLCSLMMHVHATSLTPPEHDAADHALQPEADAAATTAAAAVEAAAAEVPIVLTWTALGKGISKAAIPSTASTTTLAALLCFGGWKAQTDQVQGWAAELHKTTLSRQVQAVYAINGPVVSTNNGPELSKAALVTDLMTTLPTATLYIAAHSSGSFVAHDVLSRLMKAGYKGRIRYANLDGATDAALATVMRNGSPLVVERLLFVSAKDGKLQSQNAASMAAGPRAVGGKGQVHVVDVPGSGCKAAWCLHDAVINTRPHNPWSFNLQKDYTVFGPPPRAVVNSWLKQLMT